MIGSNIHYFLNGSKLVVVDPVWIWGIFFWLGMAVWPLYAVAHDKAAKKKTVRRWFVIAVIAFGFIVSYQRLTLDMSTHLATYNEFTFYHWTKRVIPLDQIDRASVRTSSVSSAIQIQYADGHKFQMSTFDQMGGKDEAVFAINNFLGREH